jgi:hypothetical protein
MIDMAVLVVALCGLIVFVALFVTAIQLGGIRGLLRFVCFMLVLTGAVGLTVGTLLVVKAPGGLYNAVTRAGLMLAAGGSAIVLAGMVLDRAITRFKSHHPARGFEVQIPATPEHGLTAAEMQPRRGGRE